MYMKLINPQRTIIGMIRFGHINDGFKVILIWCQYLLVLDPINGSVSVFPDYWYMNVESVLRSKLAYIVVILRNGKYEKGAIFGYVNSVSHHIFKTQIEEIWDLWEIYENSMRVHNTFEHKEQYIEYFMR